MSSLLITPENICILLGNILLLLRLLHEETPSPLMYPSQSYHQNSIIMQLHTPMLIQNSALIY